MSDEPKSRGRAVIERIDALVFRPAFVVLLPFAAVAGWILGFIVAAIAEGVGRHRIEDALPSANSEAFGGAIHGVLALVVLRSLAAFGRFVGAAFGRTGERLNLRRLAWAIPEVLVNVVAAAFVIVCAGFGVLVASGFGGHPHSGRNRTYTDHSWESVATRSSMVRRYVTIPHGAEDMRYRIDVVEESDGWLTGVEVEARVDRTSIAGWTRGCTEVTDATAPGLPVRVPRRSPTTWGRATRAPRVFDCPPPDRGIYDRRYVFEADRTVEIDALLQP